MTSYSSPFSTPIATTRYPSLAMARPARYADESADPGGTPTAVTVDGLEVVDEQVVVLAPAAPRPGRARWSGPGDRAGRRNHALG